MAAAWATNLGRAPNFAEDGVPGWTRRHHTVLMRHAPASTSQRQLVPGAEVRAPQVPDLQCNMRGKKSRVEPPTSMPIGYDVTRPIAFPLRPAQRPAFQKALTTCRRRYLGRARARRHADMTRTLPKVTCLGATRPPSSARARKAPWLHAANLPVHRARAEVPASISATGADHRLPLALSPAREGSAAECGRRSAACDAAFSCTPAERRLLRSIAHGGLRRKKHVAKRSPDRLTWLVDQPRRGDAPAQVAVPAAARPAGAACAGGLRIDVVDVCQLSGPRRRRRWPAGGAASAASEA